MTQAPKAAPGREVVVLREGPPKGRGVWIDAVVGVLGVGLLVLAAVLGATLPEEEVPPRQFKVNYPQNGHEAVMCCAPGSDTPGLSLRHAESAPEGEVMEYELLVEHDNAFQFQFTLFLPPDDIASSDPDTLRVDLISPDGRAVGNLSVTHNPPRQNPNQNETDLFVSDGKETSGSMRNGAKPATEFVAVNDTSVTKAQVVREISINRTLATKGTWTIRAQIVDAGDCPEAPVPPTLPPTSTQRALACQQETDNSGEDAGNPFTISKVRYDYFEILVESPEEQEGGS